MMAEEITNFVTKYLQLKNAGTRAILWMESQAGEAVVTLQAHLPGFQEYHRHPRHFHPCHPRHSREEPSSKRATPSRVRRRVQREQARAQARRSDVETLDVAVAEQVTMATENVDTIPPSPPPQPDTQPKEEADQAPHLPQPHAVEAAGPPPSIHQLLELLLPLTNQM